MVIGKYKIYKGLIFILLLVLFSSCTDESFVRENNQGAFLSISGIESQSATHPGSSEDYLVNTLRVMAFNKTSGLCISNVYYTKDQWTDNLVQHPIDEGTYTFVFLANEANDSYVFNQLDAVSGYEDLNNIVYPAKTFSSDQYIPMKQEIEDVTVLSKGQGARLSDGTTVSRLELSLDRMGVRVDVVLEADRNYSETFSGVTFSNLADIVPLTANYNGTITRNTIRVFTVDKNSGLFEDTTPSTSGTVWAKKVIRVILPSSVPESKSDKSKAAVFTVNMGANYNPSCELKIASAPVDYSLPGNTKLDLTGIIRESLEVNIEASKWNENDDAWNIPGLKVLNISHTEVSITDFNGARISFKSNMPVVKILPEVFTGLGTATAETEKIFNDLVLKSGDVTDAGATKIYATSRYSYTYDEVAKVGTGYMDILLDELNEVTSGRLFRLVLSGEDEFGGKLQREIKVSVSQYGQRFLFNSYGTGYVGAFFRNDEMGERIISGQQSRKDNASELPAEFGNIKPWRARVISGDFITLSSTPSFDPQIGTDSPGNPEKFNVRPNDLKGEDGRLVEGRGRIYFRMATNGKHSGEAPRYAKVVVERYGGMWGDEGTGGIWYARDTMYIRQGEEDDYVMRPGTIDPITTGPLQGKARDYARKVSPYNLTAAAFKAGGNSEHPQVAYKNGAFVEYPTQAGAFFQWGLPKNDDEGYFRLAYHPTQPAGGSSYWSGRIQYLNETYALSIPVWGSAAGIPETQYDYEFKNLFEVCPEGYHRPSDGYIDRISRNGLFPSYFDRNNNDRTVIITPTNPIEVIPTAVVDHSGDIAYSEWRQSVFKTPRGGDAGTVTNIADMNVDRTPNFWSGVNTTDLSEVTEYIPIAMGFYADGFFDRRPIKQGTGGSYAYGVSIDNAKVAYRGVLVYNKNYGDASVFFPMAGRRNANSLQYAGESGYYHSASTGPSSAETPHSVWSMEFSRWPPPSLVYQLPTFAQSVRCVRDKE